jgi:hypothetical protein
MIRFSRGAVATAFAVALASCVATDPAAPESATVQALVTCPNFACAQNGPSLNNRPFHELAESHAANLEGFSLGKLTQNGANYALRVVGYELRAVSRGATLTGSQLIGASFEVNHSDGKSFRVIITSVLTISIYAGPMQGTPVPIYNLQWVETTPGAPATHYKNLCANPPTGAYRQDTLFQPGESTLVFEGNRYNAASKEVLAGDTNWFNLGCAGHALSKLFLTGHTQLTGGATPPTLLEQQTVLKTLVADYCHNGTSFTVSGEPLYWKTSNLYMSFQGIPTSFEGRWGPDGAICLDKPRLLVSTNPLAQTLFPDLPDGTPGIEAAIQAACPATRPPPCNAAPGVYDFAGANLVSANPLQ